MLPTHPLYTNESLNWLKYRLAYEGGRDFIVQYLQKYSARESDADFAVRKAITYSPSHAKAAIMEIKNSIFERMCDVERLDGPVSYQQAIHGTNGGVDYSGNDMNSFIGTQVLPELLTMRRVGVFIDKDVLPQERTMQDEKGIRPYLYMYKTEDIVSWAYDKKNQLVSVLLRSRRDTQDIETGLVTGSEEWHRLLKLTPNGVEHSEYIEGDNTLKDTILLNLTQIPFVIFEMTESLMVDIADYQIALLNLESSDIAYLLKSNFPFYTEQYSPLADITNGREGTVSVDKDGNKTVSVGDGTRTQEVGIRTGRRYPKGMERPGFINPSSEPMKVSMEKQEHMKIAIRQLVQLTLINIVPQRATSDTKQKDMHGLEAGLATIGLFLQSGENKIAEIWAEYEGVEPALVVYPERYSLTTDAERGAEAETLTKNLPKIPSLTYQKILAKRIAFLTAGRGITLDEEQKIINEIDSAEIIAVDPEILLKDLEAGLVASETASKARGYPKGDVAIAKEEHIARLAAIAIAQSKGGGAGSYAARGIPAGPQDNTAALEKKTSQHADNQPSGAGTATRGTA